MVAKNLTESEISKMIGEKKKSLRTDSFAPIEAQAVLDEITELEMARDKLRAQNIKVTPVIDAPLVKDHPKETLTKMGDTSMRLF